MAGDEWVKVLRADDVGEQSMVAVEVGDRQIAVYHLEGGEFRATDNVCSHAYALLTDGILEDGMIECPVHAGQFDVRTGKGLCEPIEEDIQTFEVEVRGGDIYVRVSAS